VLICPKCGEENPDRFKLCGFCGTQLVVAAPSEDIRKTVTIVFSDLKGSTSLAESLDGETLREVLRIYFEAMQAVLERHGGSVEKYIGDAIVAVFGLPRLHEDDAVRAVRAAAEMRSELVHVNERLEALYGVRLENRTGVNTGDVVAGDVTVGQRLVSGDAVNVAARFEQAAPANEVLVGESTYRLVKDAVEALAVEPLELKGKSERMPAYRLISVRQEEGVARRMDAPMVGRDEELAVLTDALSRARETRRCQVVTVIGPAGAGKSRLLREFLIQSAPSTESVRGRCLSYGDGITFWPLAEIARAAAGIGNDDSLDEAAAKLTALLGEGETDVIDRIAGAIGLTEGSFAVEEIFWAARRLFERLAGDTGLIVLIDDIHWAEQTFLDLIRSVARTVDAPVVLACSARRDLLDDYPDWAAEAPDWKTLVLDPLSDRESGQVVANLLGTTDLDDSVRERIVRAAEGNPLFVEQMLSMMIDDEILERDESGCWVLVSGADADAITVPPTIRALLSARIDKLAQTDRIVIERGSVIGQVFFDGAVEELSPDEIRPQVGDSLHNLTRKELIRPQESEFVGQETYRFMHILIQDAAYHGLLKRTRAELHVRLVDWFDRMLRGRVMEFEEIRGHHLEQAYLTFVQIAKPDDRIREIGTRGARHLGSAGRRAMARGDIPAAASLLRRAAFLLGADDPDRPQLLVEAAEVLMEQGMFSESDKLILTAIEDARGMHNRALELAARILQLELRYTTAPEEMEDTIVGEVHLVLPELESLEHQDGLARAWRLLTFVNEMTLRYGEAEAAAERTLEYAGRAGNRLMKGRAIPSLGYSALNGPTPVPAAVERCAQLLEEVKGDRKAEALLLAAISHLEAMRGNFDEARTLYRRSRGVLEELGWTFLAAQTSFDSGPVEMLAGDPAAAEAELRRDYDTLVRMGEKNYISTTAALLAQSVYEQGRFDEALEFSRQSEDLAASDDLTSQVLWRGVRSKVLARQGDFEGAEILARDAVRMIGGADSPEAQGNAILALAEVSVLAGRHDEAAAEFRKAAAFFSRKGMTVSEERAAARLAELDEPVMG
jgi:class 3 adenylate cyclase/tetratricopeptide (TPR) repeat protein